MSAAVTCPVYVILCTVQWICHIYVSKGCAHCLFILMTIFQPRRC